jgi:hypothetical protein
MPAKAGIHRDASPWIAGASPELTQRANVLYAAGRRIAACQRTFFSSNRFRDLRISLT